MSVNVIDPKVKADAINAGNENNPPSVGAGYLTILKNYTMQRLRTVIGVVLLVAIAATVICLSSNAIVIAVVVFVLAVAAGYLLYRCIRGCCADSKTNHEIEDDTGNESIHEEKKEASDGDGPGPEDPSIEKNKEEDRNESEPGPEDPSIEKNKKEDRNENKSSSGTEDVAGSESKSTTIPESNNADSSDGVPSDSGTASLTAENNPQNDGDNPAVAQEPGKKEEKTNDKDESSSGTFPDSSASSIPESSDDANSDVETAASGTAEPPEENPPNDDEIAASGTASLTAENNPPNDGDNPAVAPEPGKKEEETNDKDESSSGTFHDSSASAIPTSSGDANRDVEIPASGTAEPIEENPPNDDDTAALVTAELTAGNPPNDELASSANLPVAPETGKKEEVISSFGNEIFADIWAAIPMCNKKTIYVVLTEQCNGIQKSIAASKCGASARESFISTFTSINIKCLKCTILVVIQRIVAKKEITPAEYNLLVAFAGVIKAVNASCSQALATDDANSNPDMIFQQYTHVLKKGMFSSEHYKKIKEKPTKVDKKHNKGKEESKKVKEQPQKKGKK